MGRTPAVGRIGSAPAGLAALAAASGAALCGERGQHLPGGAEDGEVPVAGVELKLCAWYRRGEQPGVLGRDRGVGIAVVDRCRPSGAMSMRLCTRPPSRAAHAAANGPPAEMPSSAAGPATAASRTSAASSAQSASRRRGRGSVRPVPGRSGATSRNPSSRAAGPNSRADSRASARPWQKEPHAAPRPGNLHRDHAAVAPAHLHPPMVSRPGRAAANLPARPRTASGRGSMRTQPALPQSSRRRATPGQQSRNVTYIAGPLRTWRQSLPITSYGGLGLAQRRSGLRIRPWVCD